MPARHRSRQRALQVLFQADLRNQDIGEAISYFYKTLASEDDDFDPAPPDPFMEQLARGAYASIERTDSKITTKSENWRLDRMPAVDRNILRLAIFEMRDIGTPGPIVIDEALELARQFSGEDSVSFINGLLDAVRREIDSPEGASGEQAHKKAAAPEIGD